jgi:hypothetical protein
MSNLDLDLLTSPSSTCAVIFAVNRHTKHVLLFDSAEYGLSGYVFNDPSNDMALKEKAVEDFQDKTGIVVLEPNSFCPHVFEELTGQGDDISSKWKFVIVIQNFDIRGDKGEPPKNSKWYHRNQIRFGKIICPKERDFLQRFMGNL